MIDIVFDGPPSHLPGRFVEVEDADGKSISYGEWIERGDGYWVLRIPDNRTLIAERDEYNRLYKGALRNVQVSVAHAANLNSQLEQALTRLSYHD